MQKSVDRNRKLLHFIINIEKVQLFLLNTICTGILQGIIIHLNIHALIRPVHVDILNSLTFKATIFNHHRSTTTTRILLIQTKCFLHTHYRIVNLLMSTGQLQRDCHTQRRILRNFSELLKSLKLEERVQLIVL